MNPDSERRRQVPDVDMFLVLRGKELVLPGCQQVTFANEKSKVAALDHGLALLS